MASSDDIASVLRSGVAARRAGQLNEALQYMNEATALCGPHQNDDRAHVLRELGELARDSHNLSAAQAHYQEAVLLLRPSADRLKFAHTVRHLGDVHVKQHHWPEAESCFIEALEIYRSHPSPVALDLANAIRAYAVLKSETGPREEARTLWTEAARLYESEGIAAGVEECSRRANQLSR